MASPHATNIYEGDVSRILVHYYIRRLEIAMLAIPVPHVKFSQQSAGLLEGKQKGSSLVAMKLERSDFS
jgi:hypothetical protein